MPDEVVVSGAANEMPGGTSMESALDDIALSMGAEDDPSPGGDGSKTTAEEGRDSSSEEGTEVVKAGTDKPAGEADGKPAAETPAATPAADPNDKPPGTWRKEAQAHWATVPAEVKAEIAKRETDIMTYVQGIKPHLDVARDLEKALAPLASTYQKAGVNPWDVMPGVMNAYAIMQWGQPAQKAEMFRAMAQDMGIDIAKLASENPIDAVNPKIAQLEAQINELRSGVRNVTSTYAQQQNAKLTAEVQAFADDPANVHFYDVATDIQTLLNKGVCGTLKEAYDKAVWANPVTRQKEVEAQVKTRAETSAKAAADKAKQARTASSVNVKARNSGGRAAAVNESIDETLTSALAAIKSR